MNFDLLPDHYLETFFISMTPFFEVRASVPYALIQGLSIWEAVLISTFGSLVIIGFLLKLLPIAEKIFKKFIPFLGLILEKILEKTRKTHSEKMDKIGHFFLVLWVAIPIPGSGAWSGVLIAYLFGVPFWRSLGLIGVGILLSSSLMVLITDFGVKIWDFFGGFL